MPPANSQPRKPDLSASSKERNEYIPSFISKKPFYVPDSVDENDYLEHQRLQTQKSTDSLDQAKWYDRGRKAGPAATKWRKGACENCGSMSHKAKECLSRPRKFGAKWTGKDIQADEVVQEVHLGWDAKRDRWNGYDAADYQEVVDEYNELEKLKQEMKKQDKVEGGDGEDGEEGEGEGDKYEAETDMGRKQATSTRNLRLREDTAKYLLNLDLDSAKYDPKTRSMVDSGANADQAAALVAEEGFMRASGDAAEFERAQKYAWETQERGDKNKLHLQANPTSGEFFRKKEAKEADERKEAQRKALLEKYGGAEHLKANPLKNAKIEESERYVEYDKQGKIKGAPKLRAKSKYPEDVLINNHTSVWGSWWSKFQWGFACCHSTTKNSYCTGEEGKKAFEETNRLRTGADLEANEVEEVPKQVAFPNAAEEDGKVKKDVDKGRKRAFEQMHGEPTEEEMDEYRRKRTVGADPMKGLLGQDHLLS